MLFEARFRDQIADGSVTLTFRRWKRCQVVAGHRYRTAAGMIEVEAVDIVDASSITDADAHRAGYASAQTLFAGLRNVDVDVDNVALYRVQFHTVTGPDPRDELASAAALTDDDVAEIDKRLERLDRASSHGAWTAAVLAAIERRPGVRAPDLAKSFGRETQPFKVDVRKLKNLGLTISLKVGYRLSPRGGAYVRRTKPIRPMTAPLIVVMGVTGSGKTTIGALLARELGVAFVDGDDFHDPTSIERMRRGEPLDDAARAPWLDRLNAQLRLHAATGVVLACSALTQSYRDRLTDGVDGVRFVLLTADPHVLRTRIATRTDHFAPAELLPSQLATLEPPHDAIVVDVTEPPDVVVAQAVEQLTTTR